MLAEQQVTDIIQGLWGVSRNVCIQAVRERADIGGAVNWADLHPCEVEYRRNREGAEYFCVIVEEAAPDADALATFIQNKLCQEFEALGIRITCETEW